VSINQQISTIPRMATALGGIKSRTFKDIQATSRPFSKCIQPLLSAGDSSYSINSVSNTDVHYIAFSSPMTTSFTQAGRRNG